MQPESGNTVWVVIAAYNEARVIAAVIGDLLRAGYRVVVVDDGSRDATARIAAQAGAALVKHPINLGQGAGLQTGIEYSLREGADFVVTFDGDGQHRVSDIAGLVDALHAQRADFVLGSRYLGGAVNQPPSYPFLRLVHTRELRPKRRPEVVVLAHRVVQPAHVPRMPHRIARKSQ